MVENSATNFYMIRIFHLILTDKYSVMFRTKAYLIAGIAYLLLLMSCSSQKKTTGLSEAQVVELVNSGQYQFKAQNMFPSGGKMRVLTENYTLNVSPTEINADLPYVGRAYNAPVNSADVGVRFVSKDFTYEKSNSKKSGWDITVTPKDGNDVRSCQLAVYENGNANLTVNSNNRQTISYTGIIVPWEKKGK
jgi:hypothetical protein